MAKTKTATVKRLSPSRKLMIAFVLIVAAVGTYILTQSQASTPTYYSFLNAGSAAQTAGVSQSTDNIKQIGTQTVSAVLPGGQLTYLTGGKVAYKSICYYVRAVHSKETVSSVATVKVAGFYNAAKVKLPMSQDYRSLCVRSGNSKTLKSYNVYNASGPDGPVLLVYQAVLSFK